MLDLRTLGTLDLQGADGVTLQSVLLQPKRAAILVYLAVARPHGVHQRDELLPLFWPESDEASARHSLSQALYALRRSLGAEAFETAGRDGIAVNPEAVRRDVVAFQDAVDAGRWQEALQLYAGPFLHGFHLPDAPGFERWADAERERLRTRAAATAWALARAELERGDAVEAERRALAAIRLLPTNEAAVKAFLGSLCDAGDRAGAARFYRGWVALLADELELEPSPEIAALAREMTGGDHAREAVPGAVEQAIATALAAVPADRLATASRFAEALERESSVIAPMPTPAAPRSRRYVPFGAVAALVTVLLLGAWWMTERPSAASPIRSLAVLPLNNLMGDSAQDYFVDGMHEALTTELSKIGALKVISRTSAMRYRGTDKGIPQIARELGVQALIEGSVLREGDQVRIAVQLIDGVSDQRIWGDGYQRELSDILSLQQDVARAVAAQIQVQLADTEEASHARAPTVDPAAYEDYLRGLNEWSKFTAGGWEAAIGYFQKSIEQAPSFAPAYAMMSFAYSWLGYYTDTSPALLRSGGLNAAERAVALDPSLSEAHASLALVKTTFDWDWLAADQASQEALRLNPNSALALLSRGFFLSWVGRHDEAIAVGRRAVELDPVAPYPNTWLGWIHFMARRYDDAIAQVNSALALEPRYRDAHVVLAWAYAKKGMFDQALATRRRLEELWPERSLGGPPGWQAKAWILALAGRADEARAILDQVPGDVEGSPDGAFWLALSYGELGERDRAFALLDVAYQGRDALLSVLNVDPRFDALRDDSRFDDLLQRMNFLE